jgi:phage terminase Nu1 subunit (DNA packaging protein)
LKVKNDKKSTPPEDTEAINLENWWIRSTKETQEFFGVSAETLSNWEKRGAPKEGYGKWDIKKLVEWKYGGGIAASDEARKLKADADYRERKAAKEEIALAVLQGEYISKEEVDKQWTVIGNQLKSNLLLWTKTLAPELAGLEMRSVEKVLTDAVYDLLEQLSSKSHYKKPSKSKKNTS